MIWLLAPIKPQASNTTVTTDQAMQIVQQRCMACHSSHPTDNVFTVAPAGVMFDNAGQITQWAARIKARAVDSKDMPFMNKTQITDQERAMLGQWAVQQH